LYKGILSDSNAESYAFAASTSVSKEPK
jgi:hypothetical protein